MTELEWGLGCFEEITSERNIHASPFIIYKEYACVSIKQKPEGKLSLSPQGNLPLKSSYAVSILNKK